MTAKAPTPVTATVNPEILSGMVPPDLRSLNTLARLAREVAIALKAPEEIIKDWGLTPEDFDKIKQIDIFQKMVTVAKIDWSSGDNVKKRIQLEAAAILEDALLILGARMKNPKESLSAAVETGKLLRDLAGLNQTLSPGAGEKFVINIDLGEDRTVQITKDVTPHAAAVEKPIPVEIRTEPEGENNTVEVQPIPEGPNETGPRGEEPGWSFEGLS